MSHRGTCPRLPPRSGCFGPRWDRRGAAGRPFVQHRLRRAQQMTAQRAFRRWPVPLDNRLDDLVMLRVGPGDPRRIRQLRATERGQLHPHRFRHLGEILVMAARIDQLVKPRIRLLIARRIAGPGHPGHRLVFPQQGRALFHRHALRRETPAQRLDLAHRLEQLVDPLG